MSDVATTTAPTAAPAKPAAGSPDLITHHAKLATAAYLAGKDEAAAPAPAEEAPAETPERGPDGKFKPRPKGKAVAKAARTEATEPTEAPAEPAEAPAEEPEPIAASGGLSDARRFVREGDIAKALKLIGLSPEKLEGRQWGAFRQREAQATAKVRAAEAKEQELQRVGRQLEQHYSRFELAQQAYQAEDYDQAFKLAFNEDPNDYARKRVHAMNTKDPEVAKLKHELKSLRQQAEEREQQQRAAQAEAATKQRRADYIAAIPTQLEEIGGYERVAHKQAFIQKVFSIQAEHYDAGTDTTLDLSEAAALAYEDLYEGVVGETDSTAAKPASKPAVAAKAHVRQAAKATTSLNSHEAAEAAPAPKLTGDALVKYYARKAELAMQAE